MKARSLAILLLGIAVAACSNDKFVGRSNLTVEKNVALPAPALADLRVGESSYVVGPADELQIVIFGIEEASLKEAVVDPSGNISVPIAGSVHAGGLTPHQLADAIAARLRQNYVRHPQVSVNVAKIGSQLITVDGEVSKPGSYPVGGQLTLIRAIANAEGMAEFANAKLVVVYRTVRDQKYAALYDVRAIRAGMYEDPRVFPGDVVVVGESRARRIFKDVIAGTGLITAPLIALTR